MKDENYIVIHGWMLNQLNLSGTQLMLYAIIHGFSQDGHSFFTGSLKYLQVATRKSRSTVIDNLMRLEEKGLVLKFQEIVNKVTYNKYRVVRKPDGGGTETGRGGSTKTVPNSNNLYKPIKKPLEDWPTFDDFWKAYDKKRGDISKLEKKWYSISKTERKKIMAYVPAYIKDTPEKKFRKDPSTFLNQKSWNDELVNQRQKPKTSLV